VKFALHCVLGVLKPRKVYDSVYNHCVCVCATLRSLWTYSRIYRYRDVAVGVKSARLKTYVWTNCETRLWGRNWNHLNVRKQTEPRKIKTWRSRFLIWHHAVGIKVAEKPLKTEAAGSSKTSIIFTKLHGVTFRKINLVTAVRNKIWNSYDW
jgi:hypothetical protein